jgi:SAM-dependent methyltransferase
MGNTTTEAPIRINLGCGINILGDGWINVDKFYDEEDLKRGEGFYSNCKFPEGAIYVKADARELPFKDSTIDYIESVDMIEHIPFHSTVYVLAEAYRVLKPGGTGAIMTTNFDALAKLWVEQVADKDLDFSDAEGPFFNLVEVVYGNQKAGGEYHVAAFNPRYMNTLLLHVGFTDIVIEIYPTDCTDMPKLETINYGPGTSIRTEMLVARFKKPE